MQLPSSDSTWFVIRAKAGWEHLAAAELENDGLQAYVPRRRKKAFVRRHRLIRDHHEPLMCGYLFLGAGKGREIDWGRFHDGDDAWRFRHVGRPLAGSCGPLCIPASIVIKIHADEMEGLYDETGATKKANHEKLSERFADGKVFRVIDGAFASFLAGSEGVTPNNQIRALVNIFNRLVRVEFAPEQLDEVA